MNNLKSSKKFFNSAVLVFLMTVLPSDVATYKPSFAWKKFKRNPAYTLDEQLSIMQKHAPLMGEPGTFINQQNDISAGNADYLIKLAADLGYKHLEVSSPQRLIRLSAHLTETLLKPNYLSLISSSSEDKEKFEKNLTELRKDILFDLDHINVLYDSFFDEKMLMERSYAETKKLTGIINDDIIQNYQETGEATKGVCVNYTALNMYLFDALKQRYPQLQSFEFIPVSSAEHNHVWQAVYDRSTDKMTMFCAQTDDIDGKFDAGKMGLDIDVQPDLRYDGYVDFVSAMILKKKRPDISIKILENLLENGDYPKDHINYSLGVIYNSVGEQEKADAYFRKLSLRSIYGREVIKKQLNSSR